MKWYKHDSNANMDAKLQSVILEYGAEGYGLYWYCLELIAANVEPSNLTFELEHDARIIARNLNLGVQRVEEMMKFMVSLGLFETSNGIITCMKMAKRADDYTAKLIRENPAQVIDSKGVRQTPTKSEKVPLDKIRIEENRTDKISKSRFSPPTISDVINYCNHSGKQIDAERFVDFYESKGWMVGKNKMKDWKAAVRNWAKSEKTRGTPNAKSRLDRQDDALREYVRQRSNNGPVVEANDSSLWNHVD